LSNRPLVTAALGISFAMSLLMICRRRILVSVGGLTMKVNRPGVAGSGLNGGLGG
jgi:hypothetical protein